VTTSPSEPSYGSDIVQNWATGPSIAHPQSYFPHVENTPPNEASAESCEYFPMEAFPSDVLKIVLRFVASGSVCNLAWLTVTRSVCRRFKLLTDEIALEQRYTPRWVPPGPRSGCAIFYVLPYAAIEAGAHEAAKWLMALRDHDYTFDPKIAEHTNNANCEPILDWLAANSDGGRIHERVLIAMFKCALVRKDRQSVRLIVNFCRDLGEHRSTAVFNDLFSIVTGGAPLSTHDTNMDKFISAETVGVIISAAAPLWARQSDRIRVILDTLLPVHSDEVVVDLVNRAMELGCEVKPNIECTALWHSALKTFYALRRGAPRDPNVGAKRGRALAGVVLNMHCPKQIRYAAGHGAVFRDVDACLLDAGMPPLKALEEVLRTRCSNPRKFWDSAADGVFRRVTTETQREALEYVLENGGKHMSPESLCKLRKTVENNLAYDGWAEWMAANQERYWPAASKANETTQKLSEDCIMGESTCVQ